MINLTPTAMKTGSLFNQKSSFHSNLSAFVSSQWSEIFWLCAPIRAYNNSLLDFMNVLAVIVSTFNDHSAENFTPSHVPRTNKILSIFPEWIKKKYENIFFWPSSSSSRSLYYAPVSTRGCCGLLEHLCCFLCNPKETDVSTEVRAPSNVWITGRNSTEGGVM